MPPDPSQSLTYSRVRLHRRPGPDLDTHHKVSRSTAGPSCAYLGPWCTTRNGEVTDGQQTWNGPETRIQSSRQKVVPKTKIKLVVTSWSPSPPGLGSRSRTHLIFPHTRRLRPSDWGGTVARRTERPLSVSGRS